MDLAKEKRVFSTLIEIRSSLKLEAATLKTKNIRGNYYFINNNLQSKPLGTQITKHLQSSYQDVDAFKKSFSHFTLLYHDQTTKKIIACYCKVGFPQGVCVHKLALQI